MPNGSHGKGPPEGRGRPGGPPGLSKEHEITRINPETGEEETQTVTQQEWKDGGRQLRAEGWTRPEDEEEEPEPGEPGEGDEPGF